MAAALSAGRVSLSHLHASSFSSVTMRQLLNKQGLGEAEVGCGSLKKGGWGGVKSASQSV